MVTGCDSGDLISPSLLQMCNIHFSANDKSAKISLYQTSWRWHWWPLRHWPLDWLSRGVPLSGERRTSKIEPSHSMPTFANLYHASFNSFSFFSSSITYGSSVSFYRVLAGTLWVIWSYVESSPWVLSGILSRRGPLSVGSLWRCWWKIWWRWWRQ